MTSGPRGPTEGLLDLRAVEARLNATEVCYECREEMQALLVHCRALRAALDEWLSPLFDEREIAERRARSVAVLNQVIDGEVGLRR